MCEPTGHLVHLDWLVPRGAGFVARDGYNLLASTDPWCAPVAAQVGPDGAVWMLDWYNYVIQHNPTPQGFRTGPGNAYETSLRDQAHGRVYRVVHAEGQSQPAPRLDRDNPDSLLAALGHDNFFWRLQAQRLLVERNDRDLIAPLTAIIARDENSPKVVHALAVLAGLNDDEQLATACAAVLKGTQSPLGRCAARGARLSAAHGSVSGTDSFLRLPGGRKLATAA